MDVDDISAGRNKVPSGETLDGNGQTISVSEQSPALLDIEESGVTIRNLTLLGPKHDHIQESGYWDYEEDGTAQEHASTAIWIKASDVTIENVTCSGWSDSGVAVGVAGGDDHRDVTIRDSDLVDNNCRALGYGVAVYSGHALIEGCHFNNNRHDIAGSGLSNCSYEARHNHVGPEGRLFGFEMHSPGGRSMDVHHNTFEDKRHMQTGRRRSLVVSRGTPDETSYCRANQFEAEHWDGIIEPESAFELSDNQYGSDTVRDENPRQEQTEDAEKLLRQRTVPREQLEEMREQIGLR